MKTMSDGELLVELKVANEDKALEAAKELFARGPAVVPALVSLRGNKKPFAAASWLGRPTAAKLIMPSGRPGQPGSDVPVEIAALYLISAIYKGNLQFAQSPYLSDLNLPAEKRKAENSSALIEKAWQSVEKWVKRLESEGIQTLRKENRGPLDGSGVAFW